VSHSNLVLLLFHKICVGKTNIFNQEDLALSQVISTVLPTQISRKKKSPDSNATGPMISTLLFMESVSGVREHRGF